MPRDPRIVAIQRLAEKRAKLDAATALAKRARAELDAAIRHAVDVGLTTADVGRRLGVSRTRVSQILAQGRPVDGQ